jgi:hypothetical protein
VGQSKLSNERTQIYKDKLNKSKNVSFAKITRKALGRKMKK